MGSINLTALHHFLNCTSMLFSGLKISYAYSCWIEYVLSILAIFSVIYT